jgi:hypothetical protein
MIFGIHPQLIQTHDAAVFGKKPHHKLFAAGDGQSGEANIIGLPANF